MICKVGLAVDMSSVKNSVLSFNFSLIYLTYLFFHLFTNPIHPRTLYEQRVYCNPGDQVSPTRTKSYELAGDLRLGLGTIFKSQ
jgi:hypothetical protein